MLRCVAFDVGDTLTNHHHDKRYAWIAAVFNDFGFPTSSTKIRKIYPPIHIALLKKYYGDLRVHMARYRFALMLETLGYKATSKQLLNMEKEYGKIGHEATTLYPGAKRILCYCKRKGIVTAIVSNSTTKFMADLLNKFGLRDLVDITVISEEIGHEKSSLVPFRIVLEKTKFKPEECLMVGNRPDEDMRASEVGFRTCLVEYFKFPTVGPSGRIDFKVKNIRKLKVVIDRLIKEAN